MAASVGQEKDLNDKILKQIEYYFGDVNLPQDKFFQEEMKKDQGWIPFDKLLACNRIKKLTLDKDVIAAALKNSEICEVSENGTKIRRNPAFPVPEYNHNFLKDLHDRTAYINGFPFETTLDEVLEFLATYDTVMHVIMRKHRLYKSFKGSVFATFKDKETAENFVANEDAKKYKDIELIKMMQYDYWAKKSAEKKEKKALKQKEDEKLEYLYGQIMRVTELPVENIDFNVLKEFFMQYGTVAYVDYTEENVATAALKKINEAAKESDGKFLFQDTEIKCNVLEGEEERQYWKAYKTAYEAMSFGKCGKKRPYFQRGNRFKNKRPRTDETYRIKRKEENCRLKELRLKKKKLRKYGKDSKAGDGDKM
uniref:Uncharacterized protein n=1 Tax=Panagrolaimus sp. ES5 TaxID=591445 RepID=A0AC34F105_9BILA